MYYVIFLFQNKKDDRGVYPQGFHGLRNRDILFKPIPLQGLKLCRILLKKMGCNKTKNVRNFWSCYLDSNK